ncbi:hypothetical protein FVE85_4531 [Porphyridium purpureum]|uniref:AMP-activated protein kinase glycogen-binding domain-containing protein n=1 Tax=Porphyridium purpureum TaxID=35688 RepID=A0A5J4YK32_PORPP|nr:hypothetical protein FVE85_4531 [Porphyridium purpureum]|eukprot:POR5481..scf297_16
MGRGGAVMARSASVGGDALNSAQAAGLARPPRQPDAAMEKERRKAQRKGEPLSREASENARPDARGRRAAPANQSQDEYLLQLAGINQVMSGGGQADLDHVGALRSVASMSVVFEGSSNEERLRVPVEFIFGDANQDARVALCGDWNSWRPIPMQRAKQSNKLFSVVTLLPAGYCEYFFLVNGERVVSQAHPRNLEGSANWRNIVSDRRLRSRKTITRVEPETGAAGPLAARFMSMWRMVLSYTHGMFGSSHLHDEESGSTSPSRSKKFHGKTLSLLERDDLIHAWMNMKPAEVRSTLFPVACLAIFFLVYICGYMYISHNLGV